MFQSEQILLELNSFTIYYDITDSSDSTALYEAKYGSYGFKCWFVKERFNYQLRLK